MKNVQTRKLMTVILVALMLFVIGCCGILAANRVLGASENTAVAAEIPVTTKIELTDNLNEHRMYKGQSFTLTLTITSLLPEKDKTVWSVFDLRFGPLTPDGTAFDKEIASKLRVKPVGKDSDDDIICTTNLYTGNGGYDITASSDQLQSNTGEVQGAVRISVYAVDPDELPNARGNKLASEPVTFNVTIEIVEDLDASTLTFGFPQFKETLGSICYGADVSKKHTFAPSPKTVGFITHDTNTVIFITDKGLNENEGDKNFTSFDIVEGRNKLLAVAKNDNVFKFVVSENTEDLILVPFFSAGINALVGVSDGSENFVPNESITSNGLFKIENLSPKYDRVVLQTTDANGEVATYYVEIWKNGAYLSDLTVKDNELTTVFHPHTYDYEIDLPAATETELSLKATVFEGMSVKDTINIEAKSGCTTVKTTSSGEDFTVKVGEAGGSIVLTVSSEDGKVTNDYTVKFNVAKQAAQAPAKSNTALYAIIGVLAGLVVAGLVIFLIIFLKKKKKEEEENTQA